MPELHLYEYAVIRVVPRVDREEFLNVGVVLYCAGQGFLKSLSGISPDRLRAFSPSVDATDVTERLRAFESICGGRQQGGSIGQLPLSARFRWLTATRSTVVQTSAVHPGLCVSAAETLQRLYSQLVDPC